jgi:hypothetical protein
MTANYGSNPNSAGRTTARYPILEDLGHISQKGARWRKGVVLRRSARPLYDGPEKRPDARCDRHNYQAVTSKNQPNQRQPQFGKATTLSGMI